MKMKTKYVLVGVILLSTLTFGCSSYNFGELNSLTHDIVQDLNKNTPYSYAVDKDGNEDPGNEVYVGWTEGTLEVSVDAEFAESQFCNEEYPKKELQQNPEKMKQEMNKSFNTLLNENPYLNDIYFYAFRDTMRDLGTKNNTGYYSFELEFKNGDIWNVYTRQEAQQLYESLKNSTEPMRVASQQLREHGRFECSVPGKMPRPPEKQR